MIVIANNYLRAFRIKPELMFRAILKIIEINPFIFVLEEILNKIFEYVVKTKGHISIGDTLNNEQYKQSLIPHRGSNSPEPVLSILKGSVSR